mmetsp:Transcript_8894/g.26510  ORF Transcript_8894/g.26510 Transcript_8894/m.26510 type:complete len:218 (-) Transcript_8894:577-1230(-)
MTPFWRRFDMAHAMTTAPMSDTSSMQSLPRTAEVAIAGAHQRRETTAIASATTCATGSATANSAYMTRATPHVASPVASHCANATMHCQMPASLCKSSGRRSMSKMGAMARRSGLAAYKVSRSKCSPMTGMAKPAPKSAQNAAASASAASATIRPLQHAALAAGWAGAAPSFGGASGTRRPKDEMVEPTQKTQKHVKPGPRRKSLCNVGGLFRVRNK